MHYKTCDICEERRIGIISDANISFCEVCGKRELDHNIRLTKKIMQQIRSERCKFWGVCEYKQEDGYTCNHEDEASSGYCGKYRELDKK